MRRSEKSRLKTRRLAPVPLLLLLLVALLSAAPADAARTLYSTVPSTSPSPGKGQVGAFPITLSSGALASPGTLSSDSTTGGNTLAVAVSPRGDYVYAVQTGADTVDVFSVASDGTLTLKSTSPQITGMASAIAVAVAPDGNHIYVVGNNGQHQPGSTTQAAVQALTVSSSDGSLSLDGSLRVVGSNHAYQNPDPFGIAISPDGGHLFLATLAADQISQVVVNADGSLGAFLNVNESAGSGPLGLAISPNDNALYVTNAGSTGTGTSISAYPLSAGAFTSGTPTPMTVPSGGDNPVALAVSPDATHLWVENEGDYSTASQSVVTFALSADGTLTGGASAAPLSTIGDTDGLLPASLVVTPDGNHVYLGNFLNSSGGSPGNVVIYSVGANGALTRVGTGASNTRPEEFSLAITPNQGPVASFTPPATTAAGSAASFDGSTSSDPDGTVARYDWDFGDGTSAANAGPNPSHTYASPGTYNVSLTVTDNEGCSTKFIDSGQTALCNGGPAATQTVKLSVGKAVPSLSTTPSAGGPPGTTVSDVAHLGGLASPDGSGSVSFKLYPAADSTCSGTPTTVTATPSTVTANGDYTSANIIPATPGTYHWIATFSGDANNNSVSSSCSDETVTISKATPTLSTTPSAGGTLGTAVSDVAHLSGLASPDGSGTVSFKLYPAGDSTCTGTPTTLASTPTSVAANGDYTSASTTPSAPGTYHWIATFSGDANNATVSSNCSDESVTITKAGPSISTTPSAGGNVGTAVSDVAHLSGLVSPDGTGSVSFALYNNASCTGTPTTLASTPTSVAANGDYTSASTTPSAPGTYHWIATFSGDANNATISSNCSDESVTITNPVVIITGPGIGIKATPAITTTPSAGGSVGTPVSDLAHLSGLVSPDGTGSVSFALYNNGSCTGTPTTLASTPTSVAANGDYTSASTTPSAPGTYHWIATFSGDTNNNTISSNCSDETVTISKATPTLSSTPSAGGTLGTAVSDVAHLSGLASPDGSGTVSFKLYPAGDSTCSGTPTTLAATPKTVSANGNYASTTTTPGARGTYHWIATFSGDANNATVASNCSDESVTITSSKAGRVSAGLAVGGPVALRAQRGCTTEINRATSASVHGARCRTARLIFSGSISRLADGEIVRITLRGRLTRTIVLRARARVRAGRFSFTVALPGRNTEEFRDARQNRGGDRWRYTVTYGGDARLLPKGYGGSFTLESEVR